MEKQSNNEKENQKKIALSFLAELLAKMSPEKRSIPEIGLGPKTLTIEQLMGEIEGDTEEGNLIVEAIIGLMQEYHVNEMLKEETQK